LGNCGLKRFEHECSPSDDVFRGARSYSEVQFRIRSLAPEDRSSVLKFQGHRKRCIPVVLGGLVLSKDKEKEAESSEGQTSNPEKRQEGEQEKSPEHEKNLEQEKSPEQEKNPETEEGTTNPPKEHDPEVEVKNTEPPEIQNPETGTETKTSDPPKEQDSLVTPGKSAKQIGEPITSVTPLQSAQGDVSEGWIFGEELRPIREEELPPNEFFFDRKRKAVVKWEFYHEGESTVKKFKVMTNGKNKKSDEFATEIAGTLGAYASANQFSVAMLKNHLKRKNRLIKTLEARVASAAEDAKSQASGAIELAQLADKKEIEVLKTKLEQANSVIREGRVQSSQQRDTITRLQAQLEVAKSKVIDIEIVKSRAIDIRSRISSSQQSLLNKVGEFRGDCVLMHQIYENLIVKERNAEVARIAFQEAVIATNNRFSAGSPGLTIAKQTRGNILLKNWEHDITLSKEQAQKLTNSLEETFKAINGELLGMESGGDIEMLRQMNIERISLDMKEKNERNLAEISKIGRVDMAQIDGHLIQPSTQLDALDMVDAHMGNRLPQLAESATLPKPFVKQSRHSLYPNSWTDVGYALNLCKDKHLALFENKVEEMECFRPSQLPSGAFTTCIQFMDRCIICTKSHKVRQLALFENRSREGQICINRSPKEEPRGWTFWQTL
jgi:hypothetical protein